MGAADAELKYSEVAIELSLAPSRLAAGGLAAMALSTLAVIAATPGPVAIRIRAATAVACAALECAYGLGLGRAGRRVLSVRGPAEVAVTTPGGLLRSVVRP